MDLSELLRALRRRWLIVLICTALGIGVAAQVTFSQKPQYESTARIFVSIDTTESPADIASATYFSLQRVQSYADLATSWDLLGRVIDKLQLATTPKALAPRVNSFVNPNTVIISLSVLDESPTGAQDIASVTAAELADHIAEVEKPRGSKRYSPIKATVVDSAHFNPVAVSPDIPRNLLGGVLLGLVLGCAAAILRDLTDRTVDSRKAAEEASGSHVLADIRFDKSMRARPLLTDIAHNAPRSESYRLLRTNLQYLNPDNPPKAIVITSALPGEGKTTTALNLAIASAQTGRRVLLIDGDLRRPMVAETLGLPGSVGLVTALIGRTQLAASIQLHGPSEVHVLASGPIPPNPTEVLQSLAAKELLDELAATFDLVIIDAPPLLPVSDAAVIARDVDGAILVVRHGETDRDQVALARQRLDSVGAKLFGVVLNGSPRRSAGHPYGYGYDYGYGEEAVERRLGQAESGSRRAGRRARVGSRKG